MWWGGPGSWSGCAARSRHPRDGLVIKDGEVYAVRAYLPGVCREAHIPPEGLALAVEKMLETVCGLRTKNEFNKQKDDKDEEN
jgi:hypothetical protein